MVSLKRSLLPSILYAFVLLLSTFPHSVISAATNKTKFIVGIFSTDGTHALSRWQATISYLQEKTPNTTFTARTFASYELLQQAAKAGEIDFIITDPFSYARIHQSLKLQAIATLMEWYGNTSSANRAVAIITRQGNTQIQTMSELFGKDYLASDINRSDVWWVQFDLLHNKNIHPLRNLNSLRAESDPLRLLNSVISGQVDAGVIAVHVLETLKDKQQLDNAAIRILDAKTSANFPYASSSLPYPGWAFASLPHNPERLVKIIATALYQIDPDMTAAKIGNYYGWSVPGDYSVLLPVLRFVEHSAVESSAARFWQALRPYALALTLLTCVCVCLLFLFFYIRKLKVNLQLSQLALTNTNKRLSEVEAVDHLTHLASRQNLDEHLTRAWSLACREKQAISAIILQLCYANSEAAKTRLPIEIKSIALQIQSIFKRAIDIKARYAEHEFLIILPNTDYTESSRLAQTLLSALAITHQNGSALPILRFKIGVATIIPEPKSIPDSLIAAADQARA